MRELLHLMGMPHDYEIDSMKSVNHICQNVPVNTAKDWADEVVRFCRGEAEMSSYTYLKQDNITQSIVENIPHPGGSKASKKIETSDVGDSDKAKVAGPRSGATAATTPRPAAKTVQQTGPRGI